MQHIPPTKVYMKLQISNCDCILDCINKSEECALKSWVAQEVDQCNIDLNSLNWVANSCNCCFAAKHLQLLYILRDEWDTGGKGWGNAVQIVNKITLVASLVFVQLKKVHQGVGQNINQFTMTASLVFAHRRDMELGECGRSLRSLASPVLCAFGAPSSDILLYPMLGLSCQGRGLQTRLHWQQVQYLSIL